MGLQLKLRLMPMTLIKVVEIFVVVEFVVYHNDLFGDVLSFGIPVNMLCMGLMVPILLLGTPPWIYPCLYVISFFST